ncbi:hypothetical protein A2U01_0022585 [Trifolium medium]|uniref:Transmembrane protein n=1 Tax=Trifolium medium TaxID=97028 RepID=A0A392NNT7_9FABA|nr:hypothetical protein [Trifolium medium]
MYQTKTEMFSVGSVATVVVMAESRVLCGGGCFNEFYGGGFGSVSDGGSVIAVVFPARLWCCLVFLFAYGGWVAW